MKRQLVNMSIIALSCAYAVGCSVGSSETKSAKSNQAHYDQSLPIEARVNALMSKMTPEEKVAQMFDKSPAIERLGVPQYNWWNEALHGVARAGSATVFPQAIGLAATFDEGLMLRVGTAISDEGRAKHHAFLNEGNTSMYTGLTYWSPNVNIFRDPRWGRGQETYGEDPYLTTRIAVNFVNGLQGNDDEYLKSVATLKHYEVHSGPEVSRHSDDYVASEKDLAETYFPAFKDTIAETNVSSVMCAYNSVNGTPACGSEELIQNKLRDEFDFSGYIVSDCGAIADFYDPNSHHVVDTEAKAAAMAVKTGTDLNCGDHHGNTFSYLTEALKQGLIDQDTIDKSLKRLLMARFKLGMFDAPNSVPFADIPMSVVGSAEHLALSLEAAEKSLVLLKNDKTLPLKGSESVALIGPNADNMSILVGNYHGKPIKPMTPKKALEQRLGKDNLHYAPGSSLTGDVFTHFEPVSSEHFFHHDYKGKRQPGLVAEYFDEPHFGRQNVKRQIDNNIDFQWQRSPIEGSAESEFSVRWKGLFVPKVTSEYQFSAKNLSFKLDGKSINGKVALNAGQTYQFSAESNIHKYWHSNAIEPNIQLSWLDSRRDLEQEALNAAKKSDVIVFVGGISANLEGEEMPLELDGFSHGDRTHINLPKSQEALLKKLKTLGKPIVFVNMSGSAMALNWQQDNVNAVVQGFYPGETAGIALSRLIFGDFNPSGRLPVTFYKGVDDLPDFKDYSMENRTYKYYQGEVLYPFGYGLSYVDFEYGALNAEITEQGLLLNTEVSNLGDRDGEEVTQVYLSMPDAPVTAPLRQLVAFKRVLVKAKSSVKIQLEVPKSKLSYIDNNGEAQSYKGRLQITVGGGQGIKLPASHITKTSLAIR